MEPAVLLLADGRFPAGGHAYSAGVESAVDVGDVRDLATLERYLEGRLAIGVGEAAFAASAVGAVAERDRDRIAELDDEFDARVLSPRLRTVGRRLGRQMVRAAVVVWPSAELIRLPRMRPPCRCTTSRQRCAPPGCGCSVSTHSRWPRCRRVH